MLQHIVYTACTCDIRTPHARVGKVNKASKKNIETRGFPSRQKFLYEPWSIIKRFHCIQNGIGFLYIMECNILTTLQAIHFLGHAVELNDSAELVADALHLKGGALKDLGRLDEAEKVGGAGDIFGLW